MKFREDVATDFLRRNRLDPFMGSTPTNPIIRMSDLESDGKQINVPLVTQISGNGVGAGSLMQGALSRAAHERKMDVSERMIRVIFAQNAQQTLNTA
ncbi:DUF4043 family protein [Bradyrhizobium elkanii]|uniref:phage capsid family protein n=1 Tax=Bradyrhizobium elkanii TaxID=29448 RepID=UPI0030B92DBA